MVYGKSRDEAISKVKALALRVLADLLNPGVVDSVTERGLCGASMSQWPSTKARMVLAVLLRIGWTV
jgi:hypothetical protein